MLATYVLLVINPVLLLFCLIATEICLQISATTISVNVICLTGLSVWIIYSKVGICIHTTIAMKELVQNSIKYSFLLNLDPFQVRFSVDNSFSKYSASLFCTNADLLTLFRHSILIYTAPRPNALCVFKYLIYQESKSNRFSLEPMLQINGVIRKH